MYTISFSKYALLTMGIITGAGQMLFAQVPGHNSSPKQLVDALHTAFGDHHA